MYEDDDLIPLINLNTGIVYYELPIEEEFRRQDAEQSVALLVKQSNKIPKMLIANFDKSKHIKLTADMEEDNALQYFIIDDVEYILNDTYELNNMYETLPSLKNLLGCDTLRKNKGSIFGDLTKTITEVLKKKA